MNDPKEIRQQLKAELGFNARQVSLRAERHGTLTFTIRDTNVSFDDVLDIREFASKFERIHRCEITHEILSGGNTFVYVRMTDEVEDALTADLRPLIAAALRNKEVEDHGTKIDGVADCFMWRTDHYTCSVSVDGATGFGCQCYCDINNEANFNSAVKSMALDVLEQRARIEADELLRMKHEAEDAKRAEEVAAIQQNDDDDSNVVEHDFTAADKEADVEQLLRDQIAKDAANGAPADVIADHAEKLRAIVEAKAEIEIARQEAEKAQQKLNALTDSLQKFEQDVIEFRA